MLRVRERCLHVSKHAQQGMTQERPPISLHALIWLFEDPDHDDGKEVRKRIGRRVIRAYYSEDEEDIVVRAVSCSTDPKGRR